MKYTQELTLTDKIKFLNCVIIKFYESNNNAYFSSCLNFLIIHFQFAFVSYRNFQMGWIDRRTRWMACRRRQLRSCRGSVNMTKVLLQTISGMSYLFLIFTRGLTASLHKHLLIIFCRFWQRIFLNYNYL